MHQAKCLAAIFFLTATAAMAQTPRDYDPALEAAAINVAVSKLGPLRGAFGEGRAPEFYRPVRQEKKRDPSGWQDGLIQATDLPVSLERP